MPGPPFKYSGSLGHVRALLEKLGPSFQSDQVTVEFQGADFEEWFRQHSEYLKNLQTKKERVIEKLRSKVEGARTFEELEQLVRSLT